MYAREKRVQAVQSHPSSSGAWSRLNRAFLRFRRPAAVIAVPVRPMRGGRTQSNMSIPAETASSTPSVSPMPMK